MRKINDWTDIEPPFKRVVQFTGFNFDLIKHYLELMGAVKSISLGKTQKNENAICNLLYGFIPVFSPCCSWEVGRLHKFA